MSAPKHEFSREDVCFLSGAQHCAGWLYRPTSLRGRPLPCIVMAHGFGGTRGMRLDVYAERFAKLGYVVLAFDYRHFGDSEGEPRQLLDIPSQLADVRAAVRHARTLRQVDPMRIVLWGTSLGGGHMLATAARDHRIAAVIAQAPHVSALAALCTARLRQQPKLLWAALRDLHAQRLGRAPHYIPIVGRPGSLAALTSRGALEALESLRPPGFSVRDDVAARVLTQIVRYSPGRAARHVRCPLLVLLAEQDELTPARAAERVARRARVSEVRTYPVDHFDLYTGPFFERAMADMSAFLVRHVPALHRDAHASI